MNRNVIRCQTMEQFCAVIAGLVMNGLSFEADADRLTVTTTGGF